jgi:hypothetical protein
MWVLLLLTMTAAVAGTLPIEQVRGGMLMMTCDQDRPEAGTWAGVVTRTFRREVDHLLRVHLADGGSIDCTDEHPFYAVDRGWTGSGSLRPGDRVLAGLATGSCIDAVGVMRVERIAGGVVYNFEVATDHTYFVCYKGRGALPVWVHNKCRFEAWKDIIGVQELSKVTLAQKAKGAIALTDDEIAMALRRPTLSDAELSDAMNAFITQGNAGSGRVWVREGKVFHGRPEVVKAAQEFDDLVHVKIEMLGGGELTPALMFGGIPGKEKTSLFVKLDGVLKDNPNILVDIKRNIPSPSARKFQNTLDRWALALKANPAYSILIVVPDQATKLRFEAMIQRALDDTGRTAFVGLGAKRIQVRTP